MVAVTVEQGGWGASAAAPAARLILSQWFGVERKLVVGSSQHAMTPTGPRSPIHRRVDDLAAPDAAAAQLSTRCCSRRHRPDASARCS